MRQKIVLFLFSITILSCTDDKSAQNIDTSISLEELFNDWRAFEIPPLRNGVPDYTQETFDRRADDFQKLRNTLEALVKDEWPIEDQIDWHILWAEMNGYEFNTKVLKSWQRDPAFYKVIWTAKSDVPAHEGPTPHFVIELWQYDFPLNAEQRAKFTKDIGLISNFYEQAKENLTGNARDLWIAGIRDIETQVKVLQSILEKPGVADNEELVAAIDKAQKATIALADWLKEQAPSKNGPSGIGKDHYTWYQQNVHLVPLTWEDEVFLLKRELARSWSSLKLEEHKNRALEELSAADSPEAYDELARKAAKDLLDFLDKNDIVTVADYFEGALNAHLGGFVPEETRNFFWITAHLDPKPLFSHFYHWFELARMQEDPNPRPIRKQALLYNIFDSRNEGLATAVEEMFMQAGLYSSNPRAREIVYILISQRAARGLGSLYAHANMMPMEEAGKIHAEYTPRGWMKTEKELLLFEQHLYLRQPGYGTSYITGKYLIEEMMMEVAKKDEAQFELKNFFDSLNRIGNIPVSLGRWEMTGDPSQLNEIIANYKPL
ncbi:MAG: hypothetical protein ACPGAO_05545 [Flavobacteriaceae bacterium]